MPFFSRFIMTCPPTGPAASTTGISSMLVKTVAPTQIAASRTCTTRNVRNKTVPIGHLLSDIQREVRLIRDDIRWGPAMNKGRLEAFSDGVMAIIITIMVLELKTPEGTTWDALVARVPILLIYILSFVYLGIYWVNHHHLLQATRRINGRILWANLHLLFWLSLTPFAMGWMGAVS